MSTSSSFTFSHRQSIKIALQYAGLDAWAAASQAAPCVLQIDVIDDTVNLSVKGFAPHQGDPCFLHAVPAAEAARIIEQYGEERMDGIDPPQSYATADEAREMWRRL